MRLKDGIIVEKINNQYLLLETNDDIKRFNGMIKNNESANYLLKLLKNDITDELMIKKLADRYNVSLDIAREDVDVFLQKIRLTGIIEE